MIKKQFGNITLSLNAAHPDGSFLFDSLVTKATAILETTALDPEASISIQLYLDKPEAEQLFAGIQASTAELNVENVPGLSEI